MSRQFKTKNNGDVQARLPDFGITSLDFGKRRAIRAAQTESQPQPDSAPSKRTLAAPVRWIEDNVIDPTTVNQDIGDYSHAKRIKLEPFQRDILNHLLRLNSSGRFPYRTVVWSQIKKSGKTQIAGAVGAYVAAQLEAPNLVLTVANDREQSAGRIFAAMKPSLDLLGCRVPRTPNAVPLIVVPNGTHVRAIPNNYAGEAGANYGLTLWSELWAFTSERGQRLYEELMPVPTRLNSIRWVETYAGFEDESNLLLNLFLKVFTDTTEAELQPHARPVEALRHITTQGRPACYEVPREGLFVFWDHERRMSWQLGDAGDEYYAQQQHDLRQSAYVRLCENRWQTSEHEFISEDWWRRSVKGDSPIVSPMYVAIDASQRHDTTSVVGVTPYMRGKTTRFRTGFVAVHDPHGVDINLDKTAADDVRGLWRQGLIIEPVFYDPFQMHQVAMELREEGIACEEFPQGAERTRADTLLWQCYRDDTIDNYDHPDLKAHVRGAKARELENEQLRIVKGTKTDARKVDAAVSQSMATYKASLGEPEDDSFSVLAQDTTEGGWFDTDV